MLKYAVITKRTPQIVIGIGGAGFGKYPSAPLHEVVCFKTSEDAEEAAKAEAVKSSKQVGIYRLMSVAKVPVEITKVEGETNDR